MPRCPVFLPITEINFQQLVLPHGRGHMNTKRGTDTNQAQFGECQTGFANAERTTRLIDVPPPGLTANYASIPRTLRMPQDLTGCLA